MATKTTPLISLTISDYLEFREGDLSYDVHRILRYTLRRVLAHVGDKQIGRLSVRDLETWSVALRRGTLPTVADRASQSNGPEAFNKALQNVTAWLAWCSRHGWCRGDLTDGIRKLKPSPRRNWLRLSADGLMSLLDVAEHPRDRGLLAFAINTALRGKEVRDVVVGSVDLPNGEVYVEISKTGESDYAAISADLDAELRRWMTTYAGSIDVPLQPHHYLFPAKGRSTFNGRGNLVEGKLDPERRMTTPPSRIVQAALLRTGFLPAQIEREGMHTLRRSVARLYFDACRLDDDYSHALREVMALLHHKSVATTEKYLGLDVDRAARDRRLKGKPFLSAMTETSDNVIRLTR